MPITRKDGTVEYEGLVLSFGTTVESLWERDEYWALVWDTATGEDKRVSVGGRQWMGTGVRDKVDVDATPEIRNAFYALTVKRCLAYEQEKDLSEAMQFEIGRQVQVIKGRKIPIGSKGVIYARDVDGYKSSRYHTEYRLGLILEDDTRSWTAESNCKILDPQELLSGWDEILRRAHQAAQQQLEKLTWEVAHAGR